MSESGEAETLGHGDHWAAFFEDPAQVFAAGLIKKVATEGIPKSRCAIPWGHPEIQELIRTELELVELNFCCLLGLHETEKQLRILSLYPRLLNQKFLHMEVLDISDAYGCAEGMVTIKLPDEAPIHAFAPLFADEQSGWIPGSVVAVGLSALALEIGPFKPAAVKVGEGPLADLIHQLEPDGSPGASWTLRLDTLRHFESHPVLDHALVVGEVKSLRELPFIRGLPFGLIMEIEVSSGASGELGRTLPLYAFEPALGGYWPKVGDVVSGTVWMQASLRS